MLQVNALEAAHRDPRLALDLICNPGAPCLVFQGTEPHHAVPCEADPKRQLSSMCAALAACMQPLPVPEDLLLPLLLSAAAAGGQHEGSAERSQVEIFAAHACTPSR